MKIDIYYNEYVEVYSGGDLILTAKIKSGLVYRMEYYYKEKLILKTRVIYLGIFRKAKIVYQDLLHPITSFKQSGSLEFMMEVYSNRIRSTQNVFKRDFFQIFLNDLKVAYVINPKGISFGSYAYILYSEVDDEYLNLYFILILLIQIIH